MRSLSLICLFCLLTSAYSQTIYKTIDAEGKVSYSTLKPEDDSNASIIDIPPGPSQEEVNAALQQQKELQQSREEQQQKRQQEKLKAEEDKQAEKQNRKMKRDTNSFPGLLF